MGLYPRRVAAATVRTCQANKDTSVNQPLTGASVHLHRSDGHERKAARGDIAGDFYHRDFGGEKAAAIINGSVGHSAQAVGAIAIYNFGRRQYSSPSLTHLIGFDDVNLWIAPWYPYPL